MGIGDKVIRGSMIMLVIRLVQRSFGLVSMLVLARLLVPSDFGIVAAAMLWLYLADTLAETGASQYLVQVDQISRSVIDTAWTLDIFLKCLASLVLLAIGIGAGELLGDPRIAEVLIVLAPTVVLRALTNPQLHVDQRELRYGTLFRVQTSQKVVAFIVVIITAVITHSYWAIVAGHYVAVITQVVGSWLCCSGGARIGIKGVGTQWRFSRWILGRGFFGYFRAQLDAFAISHLFPASTFGQFSVARELVVMPALDIIGPITQPLLASLSRTRGDLEGSGRQVRVALLVVAILIIPVCAFLLRHAEPIVLTVLGEKWLDAAPMLVAMLPLLLSYSFGGILNNLVMASGRVKALFMYDVITVIVIGSILFVVRHADINTVILTRSISGLLITSIGLCWACRSVGVTAQDILGILLLPLGCSIFATWFAFGGEELHSPLELALNAVSMGAIYVVLVIGTAVLVRSRSPSWCYLFQLAKRLVISKAAKIKRQAAVLPSQD